MRDEDLFVNSPFLILHFSLFHFSPIFCTFGFLQYKRRYPLSGTSTPLPGRSHFDVECIIGEECQPRRTDVRVVLSHTTQGQKHAQEELSFSYIEIFLTNYCLLPYYSMTNFLLSIPVFVLIFTTYMPFASLLTSSSTDS